MQNSVLVQYPSRIEMTIFAGLEEVGMIVGEKASPVSLYCSQAGNQR